MTHPSTSEVMQRSADLERLFLSLIISVESNLAPGLSPSPRGRGNRVWVFGSYPLVVTAGLDPAAHQKHPNSRATALVMVGRLEGGHDNFGLLKVPKAIALPLREDRPLIPSRETLLQGAVPGLSVTFPLSRASETLSFPRSAP
jgi:hypothetical protein